MTNSLFNKYKIKKCYVLVEEEFDNIGAHVEISLMRRLFCLAVLFGVSKVSAPRLSKLLKLCLYKIRAITQLFPLAWEARGWYVGHSSSKGS